MDTQELYRSLNRALSRADPSRFEVLRNEQTENWTHPTQVQALEQMTDMLAHLGSLKSESSPSAKTTAELRALITKRRRAKIHEARIKHLLSGDRECGIRLLIWLTGHEWWNGYRQTLPPHHPSASYSWPMERPPNEPPFDITYGWMAWEAGAKRYSTGPRRHEYVDAAIQTEEEAVPDMEIDTVGIKQERD